MPYEYGKLTPQERKEVVESRKRRGYPLHAPPHPYRKNGTYLITAANFEHKAVMISSARRTEFQELLLDSFQEIDSEIIGWVILPNHYHILAAVESLNSVSDILRILHGRTSYSWNLQDGLQEKRKVWYKFSDRLMRDEKQLHQTLNYIHYNPVKHGYVNEVYNWEWSSIFMYINDMGRDWLQEHWKKHIPPANFGNDWDI
jgi:putative transposase